MCTLIVMTIQDLILMTDCFFVNFMICNKDNGSRDYVNGNRIFIYDGKLSITSCLASSNNIGSSKNLLIDTSSDSPLRRLVLIINSRAKAVAGCASSGLMVIDLSNGSPGTICQWWNTERQKDWPCVCVLRSVSKPNESIGRRNRSLIYCINWPPGGAL